MYNVRNNVRMVFIFKMKISQAQNNMSEKATMEIVRRTVSVRGMGEVEIGVRHYKCVLCGDLFMEIRKLEEHVMEKPCSTNFEPTSSESDRRHHRRLNPPLVDKFFIKKI